MDIYFDFEATQFSERVLAIGATCEFGDFDCLVGLHKGDKLTPFITQLTGITKEMVQNAPKAEEAFTDLYNWLSEMTAEAETPIFYHCYGNSDPVFLMNTAAKIEDPYISNFVTILAESLVDDTRVVKKYFHCKAIGLYKALKFFEPDYPEQTHDPLDDAIMLRKLMKHLETATPLTEVLFPELAQTPKTAEPKPIKECHIKGNYYIEAYSVQNPEAKPKKFTNYRAAFDFCISKVHKNHPEAKPTTMEKRCLKAIETGSIYLDRVWKKVMI